MRTYLLTIVLLYFISTNSAYADNISILGKEKLAACGVCHGLNGNSTIPIIPVLAQQHASYLIKQLLDYRLGLRKESLMQSIAAGLSDADIQAFSAYYANEKAKGGVAQRQYYALGSTLYRSGIRERGIPACTACHGPTGSGNGEARFPSLSGQHAAYTIQQLKAFQMKTRNNDPRHIMTDIAHRMTDQEIQAVASYLAGLHE